MKEFWRYGKVLGFGWGVMNSESNLNKLQRVSEWSGSCGPAGSLEMPRRPIAAWSALAPHSIPNQIQSCSDDLQGTPFKGTKLFLFHTAWLHSYSWVEIRWSTSSGKTEIIHCLTSFQKLGSGGLEQLVSKHSLCNLTREFQTTVENWTFCVCIYRQLIFFPCIRVAIPGESLHVKQIDWLIHWLNFY